MSRFRELLFRILSTVIFVPILIYSLFFEHTYLFPIILLLAGSWALFEFYDLMIKSGYQPFRITGHLFLLLILAISNNIGDISKYFPLILWIIIFIGFIAYLSDIRFGVPSFFANVGITLLGLLYIGFPFYLLLQLHKMNLGAWLIVWLIPITWFCDIGAYFVGSAIGKHKLCPTISPGKTIEGLIGGIIAALLAGSAIWWILNQKGVYLGFTFFSNLWLVLIITSIGVLGDLAESVLKRQTGVKDSGNTHTGHGGMLDIIDSLLFTVPVFYYIHQFLL